MARVTRRLVVLEDTLFVDERVQQAEKLRDPTHVSHYTRDQFVGDVRAAGLDVRRRGDVPAAPRHGRLAVGDGMRGAAADEVRRLLAHVAEPDGSAWTDVKWAAQAVKRRLA